VALRDQIEEWIYLLEWMITQDQTHGPGASVKRWTRMLWRKEPTGADPDNQATEAYTLETDPIATGQKLN
jgi:hypothetical protein